ncbi:F-box protein At3g07870-like [Mercurialis annua]|uniref:F-box protein At3g07870-like n=1 Tax=Mercurialis annua TaxID=3986 RepID=UPI00215F3811|nr:F-box protein At3g07870-like [Mercurialis annua]
MKNNATTTIESLPREIVVDILSRIPTPSLLSVKLVCRSWRNIAEHPLFVDLHFSRKTENNPCLILHCDHSLKNQLHALFLYPHNRNTEVGLVKKIQVPVMPEFDIVGSCNGWLCLFESLYKMKLFMFNPFTNSCMEFPISTLPTEMWTVFGFGFHPITNEYKVLKFSSIQRTGRFRSYGSSSRSEVQILTVGNLSWRSLGKIPYYPIQPASQVFTNGRLHWVNWPSRYKPGRELISFDLADETFREVLRPDSVTREWGNYTLMVIRGCLSAAINKHYGSFDVWIMMDYGVKESWIKQFSIGVYLPKGLEQDIDRSFRVSKFYKRSFTRILCGLKNGEILMEYRSRALVCYDPRNETFKDIIIPGIPNWFESVVHVGNLDGVDTNFSV